MSAPSPERKTPPPGGVFRCGAHRFPLDRPLVMGIVNLTPDSFSGDGLAGQRDRAIAQARAQIEAGADLLDLGAESTRPGAVPTPEAEELARLLPVLEAVQGLGVPISVDTYKPGVMRAALAAGASMINDIRGLEAPGAIEAVAGSDCGVCLMHMRGLPQSMQLDPAYRDVVGEVRGYLDQRLTACRDAGMARERLLIDPGFGFGKTLDHNVMLFRAIAQRALGDTPVLVGVSRKSMLGALTGRAVDARLPASVAAAVMAFAAGAAVVRVHDVAATCDARAVWAALQTMENEA